ncbi:hypothetical protein SLEP1_g54430 [Rubroshorea leprosula]|uniref:Uncharacterized protein n=1 Tax=Rubroshorea leprosula TaxID=152421 RepID=A0AAV5MDF3_9ROSI|nr:hypothetical protein SLEP1_g54430 [Rubroshorea leprosula]
MDNTSWKEVFGAEHTSYDLFAVENVPFMLILRPPVSRVIGDHNRRGSRGSQQGC